MEKRILLLPILVLIFSSTSAGAAMLCRQAHPTAQSSERITSRIDALIAQQIRLQQYEFSEPSHFNQNRAYIENEKHRLSQIVPDFEQVYRDRYLTIRDQLKQKKKSLAAQKQTDKQTREEALGRTTVLSLMKILEIPHESEVHKAILSPDGKFIFTGSNGHFAQIIEAASGQVLHHIDHSGSIDNPTFSPDGKFITFTDQKSAKIIETISGTVLQELKSSETLTKALVSPDGQTVALIPLFDRRIFFHDLSSGEELRQVRVPSTIQNAKFSQTGTTIAVGVNDTKTLIIEVATGKIRRTFENSVFPRKQRSSPDEKLYFLILHLRTAVAVLDFTIRNTLYVVKDSSPILDCAFSPDGKLFAVAFDNKKVKIYNSVTGDHLDTIDHEGQVNSIAFSRDGQFILTASSDKTVRLTKLYVNLKDEKL